MTIVELHPEDLIDKELLGQLTPSEKIRLDTHRASCVACMFELEARNEFHDECANEIQKAKLHGVVSFVMGHAQQHCESPEQAPLRESRPLIAQRTFRRRVLEITLVAAALLMFMGMGWAAWQHRSSFGIATTPNSTSATTCAPNLGDSKSGHTLGNIPQNPTPSEAAAPIPMQSATPSTAPSTPARALQSDSAGDVFRHAGQLRRAGKYEQALAAYRDLQTLFPASEEAHVALVAMGRLLLDQGRASEAFASFNRYLTKGGSLAEDSLVGRAWALHQLGRAHDEAAAWHALLEQFPGSAHAAEARAQISALESP